MPNISIKRFQDLMTVREVMSRTGLKEPDRVGANLVMTWKRKKMQDISSMTVGVVKRNLTASCLS